MRHVVLVGPQGAGKGTQAERIAPDFNLVHLATGDLFRALMKRDTELSREVRSYYDRGDLVPDDVTARVLFSALDEEAAKHRISGALFDGYPRNSAQAAVLDEQIDVRGEELAAVVHLEVPHDVLMKRLTGRLICSQCGATFHREFNPPANESVCDVCGGELYQRSDDTPEAVERRLQIYYNETQPLLERWRDRGKVWDIDGDQDIEAVTALIKQALSQSALGANE